MYLCKGLSVRNLAAMEKGKGNSVVGLFIADALFATLTNVNFDKARFTEFINKAVTMRDALPKSDSTRRMHVPGRRRVMPIFLRRQKPLVSSLPPTRMSARFRSTLVFGLKGITAYYTHAAVLGKTDAGITTFLQKGLASTIRDLPVTDMIALVMECGDTGVKVLALLDEANTSAYGEPESGVKTTVGKRPGILITGHDLKDLEMLLEQSPDAGVDVYTHGEMLRPTLTRHSRMPPGRQLRQLLVAPEGGVRAVRRAGPVHDQLPRPSEGHLQRPPLHNGPDRLPGRPISMPARTGRRTSRRSSPLQRPASHPGLYRAAGMTSSPAAPTTRSSHSRRRSSKP